MSRTSKKPARRLEKKRYRQEAKNRLRNDHQRARRFSSQWGGTGSWVERTLP